MNDDTFPGDAPVHTIAELEARIEKLGRGARKDPSRLAELQSIRQNLADARKAFNTIVELEVLMAQLGREARKNPSRLAELQRIRQNLVDARKALNGE